MKSKKVLGTFFFVFFVVGCGATSGWRPLQSNIHVSQYLLKWGEPIGITPVQSEQGEIHIYLWNIYMANGISRYVVGYVEPTGGNVIAAFGEFAHDGKPPLLPHLGGQMHPSAQ